MNLYKLHQNYRFNDDSYEEFEAENDTEAAQEACRRCSPNDDLRFLKLYRIGEEVELKEIK